MVQQGGKGGDGAEGGISLSEEVVEDLLTGFECGLRTLLGSPAPFGPRRGETGGRRK